jgi:aryl-alcohol dehydrogenase-like predicted oxidoreductase
VQTRRIGSLEVSVVGVGCNNFGWRIDEAATRTVVDAALDAGINLFDTADIYGDGQSEELLGRALRGRAHRAVIATKFGMASGPFTGGASPAYVRSSVEGSLQRLGVDTIDLYQVHRPDPGTPIADTLGALDDLVKAGKVREIGCSNFTVAQLREAAGAVRAGAQRFVSAQNELSLLATDATRDLLPECVRSGVAFLPYFPLASGLLTGKYRRGAEPPAGARLTAGGEYFAGKLTDAALSRVEDLVTFAAARGHSLLELAVAWLLSFAPVASVIAGATRPGQIRDNAGAAGWTLSAADLEELHTLLARPS